MEQNNVKYFYSFFFLLSPFPSSFPLQFPLPFYFVCPQVINELMLKLQVVLYWKVNTSNIEEYLTCYDWTGFVDCRKFSLNEIEVVN
jgi:hypothetical protein